VARKFGFFVCFNPLDITLKQLCSLALIDTFSWLGVSEVTHWTVVQEVPGSITGSGKAF